jgi:hypothetical protein
MKKTLITIAILFVGTFLYAQDSTKVKSEPRDSITASDIQKHIYMSAVDIYQYNQKCYQDSIPITSFYGEPVGGTQWKNKLRFYWDPFEPLPNVKYLHWRPTYQGYVEFVSQKYAPKK